MGGMAVADTLWTEADIIALKSALKSGASSVRTADGKEVRFRSLTEGFALLDRMTAEVYGSRRKRVRRQVVSTDGEGA